MTGSLRARIAGHPFFSGFPGDMLDLLVEGASEVTFERRELIFREHDSADFFYLIVKGKVAIEIFAPDRGPMTIQTADDGDIVGWSWLVEPYEWHFDAQAIEITEVIAFDAARLRELAAARPDLGYALFSRFMPVLVERLQATRMQLLDWYHVNG